MTGYTMLIYPEDKEFIRRATLEYENIETGGDLFGLWQSESEVVVQLVTGPGQNCRRTATAFYQDKNYLSDVGNYLTSNKGLCNIGEWHSHHQLNLPRPSDGDKTTIWRNMPDCGLKRFLLIIATITPHNQVNINGFMFTAPRNGDRYGELNPVKTRVLYGENPFRYQPEVLSKLRQGAEKPYLLENISPSFQPSSFDESSSTEKQSKKKRKKFKNPFPGGKNKSKNKKEKVQGEKKQKNGYKEIDNNDGTSAFHEDHQSVNNLPQSEDNVNHHDKRWQESREKENYGIRSNQPLILPSDTPSTSRPQTHQYSTKL